MANDDEREEFTLYGTVKWFDPAKGFGFIVAEGQASDVLLHANVLRNFGQSSVSDGAGIEVVAQQTERGIQAVEILRIDPPGADSESGLADIDGMSESEIKAIDMEPARIKWFDKVKGFGFANTFGNSDDIFVHIEVLRRSGLADLLPGEAVAIRIINGERGKMAVSVNAWEAAQNSKS